MFAIPVKGGKAGENLVAGPLLEWQAERDDWKTWGKDEFLEDRCLTRPLPVSALLDAVQAEKAIVNAVIASDHPDMVKHNEKMVQQGMGQGVRDSLRVLLEARGLRLDEGTQARVDACADVNVLHRWIARAATANELPDVFDDA